MKEVTYKCHDTLDFETKEYRQICQMCLINRNLFEQGLKYVTLSDEAPIENYVCPHTGKILDIKRIRDSSEMPNILIKMTPEQIKKDRKQRSSAHFKKEILPTLGRDEQRHHKNKKE